MNDLRLCMDPVKELIQTNSRLDKEAILKKNVNNEPFKEMLQYLLDGRRISGISTKKIAKDVRASFYEIDSDDYSLVELLHYFDDHKTGSDTDIAFVQYYSSMLASRFDGDYDEAMDFIYNVITKSIRLGVEVTIVNKIYGKNFIKTLDVMLGTSIENCKFPEGEYFFISQKLNGTRCFFYDGKLYSRQGKEFSNLDHIIKDLNTLTDVLNCSPCSLVFDGELLLKDRSVGDSKSFQLGTGLANSASSDKTGLQLVIFDVVHKTYFEDHTESEPYSNRKRRLLHMRNIIENLNMDNISIVPFYYEGTDTKQIWKWLDYAEKNDIEGLMLNLDVPYRFCRTKELLKVKKFYTMDLRVIDMEAGTGRNKNRLGNVFVDYRGNKVGVGSGFTDEQRDRFWVHPEEILGKIIEVKYKEKTCNKEGIESLQFPVFMGIRDDKDEVSYD